MTDPRRLVYVPVDDLPDHPRNPRDHDLEELRASVLRFGFTTPPMIDERTGLLAEGHGRKKALIKLRDENPGGPPKDLPAGRPWPPEGVVIRRTSRGPVWHVPVVRGWASADDTEAEAYLLAGNQGGGWQRDALAAVLRDLIAADGGLTGTGFDQAAYDLAISEASLSEPYSLTDEWAGMPDFSSDDLTSKWRLKVHFRTEEDYKAFLDLLGNPTVRQAAVWWPRDDGHVGEDWTKQYVTEEEPADAGA